MRGAPAKPLLQSPSLPVRHRNVAAGAGGDNGGAGHISMDRLKLLQKAKSNAAERWGEEAMATAAATLKTYGAADTDKLV